MKRTARVVTLLGALVAAVYALASPPAQAAGSCEAMIGSRCSGGGYTTCTWSDGGVDTLVCFNRTWHVA